MKRKHWMEMGLVACTLLACSIASEATPTPLPRPFTPTPAASATTPITPQAMGRTPAWWPNDLVMPNGAVPLQASPGQATWSTRDTNVDGIKTFLLNEAAKAGYQPYAITLSQGSIYNLLFAKGGNTFALNITQGTETTILTGTSTGIMHLEISGSMSLKTDLPLQERFDLTPGSEIAIGTSLPSPACSGCQYLVYIHVAPFLGPGIYETKPAGTYIIDVDLVPGGDPAADDYRWAQQCTLIVKDALSGDFACAGLQNVNDNTKRINMIGNWKQPALP